MTLKDRPVAKESILGVDLSRLNDGATVRALLYGRRNERPVFDGPPASSQLACRRVGQTYAIEPHFERGSDRGE